jgi:ferredoxin-NADP reductase
MKKVKQMLLALEIPEGQLHYEFFGPVGICREIVK